MPLPFSTGADEIGRQVGERLQVDPNAGKILFYGIANAASPTANEWNPYPLISGTGDVYGFIIHTNVSVAPTAKFSGPTCKGTTSLDYAKINSKIVMRGRQR